MPYVLKAPADEGPIDIQDILDFKKNLKTHPQAIRASIENTLSWEKQMQIVIDNLFDKQ